MTIRKMALVLLASARATPAFADETLFGYVRGAEALPGGAAELYFKATQRDDTGAGRYRADDYVVEYEYGGSDRFNPSLHHGAARWASLTWLPQLRGGERYAGEQDTGQHLIEKTKQEARPKLGLNF